MSVESVALIVALVLALVEEFRANGRSLLGWAVIIVCAVLLLPLG